MGKRNKWAGYMKSWRKSGKKIPNGPVLEEFEDLNIPGLKRYDKHLLNLFSLNKFSSRQKMLKVVRKQVIARELINKLLKPIRLIKGRIK